MSEDARWMEVALQEARRALGPCHPNPAVGAVIVENGQVVARGHTQAPGGAHAEVEAIHAWRARPAAGDPVAATLYVTLEPCCTHGRTPPCTDAILRAGLRRVVVGATDPNPRHAGRGLALLREAGIEVEVGVLAERCAALNPVFEHWMRAGRALIAGKIATTLDGRIATRTGHSRWITGVGARQDVARWRRAFPAIAVGAGTLCADDPALTARVEGEPVWCPRRLVFDRAGRALNRPEARVFSDQWAEQTVYVTAPAFAARVPAAWRARGVEVWDDVLTWEILRARLLECGLTGLYVEGGAGLLSDLLRARELDYLFAYRGAQWLGDVAAPGPFAGFETPTMDGAWRLEAPQHASFGSDQLFHGRVVYPPVS